MRYQQIFVTINMLIDHTTFGSVIPQLEVNSARQIEMASPEACVSYGVVHPLTTQGYNLKKEHAAQMKAQAEKYGTLSGAIHNDRNMMEFQPPTLEMEQNYQAPPMDPQFQSSPIGYIAPPIDPQFQSPPTGFIAPPKAWIAPPIDPNFPNTYARLFNDASDDHKYKYMIGGAVAVIHTCAAALYSLMDHVRFGRH